MNSLLLTTLARGLFSVFIAIALYLLYRGHNEPGGGFIGGLVAAVAFALIAKGMGTEKAKQTLKYKPLTFVVIGMSCALLSGLIALINDQSWMTGQWWFISATQSYTGAPLSTVLLFDVGVFFIVLGSTLYFFFSLEDADS